MCATLSVDILHVLRILEFQNYRYFIDLNEFYLTKFYDYDLVTKVFDVKILINI